MDIYFLVANTKNSWALEFATKCGQKNFNLNNCDLTGERNLEREASWRKMMNFLHKDG